MTAAELQQSAMAVIRANARNSFAFGVDEGKVAYDIVHDARVAGLRVPQLDAIFAQLRSEGYFKKGNS